MICTRRKFWLNVCVCVCMIQHLNRRIVCLFLQVRGSEVAFILYEGSFFFLTKGGGGAFLRGSLFTRKLAGMRGRGGRSRSEDEGRVKID